MSNVIDLNNPTETDSEDGPVFYELSYTDASGNAQTEIFEGDAIMTGSFIGFATEDQILRFAIPLTNMVSIRLLEDYNPEALN